MKRHAPQRVLIASGGIITGGRTPSRADAVAFTDGVVLAVGDLAAVAEWDTAASEIIEVTGTVVPGLADAHTHPLKGAERRWGTVDLSDAESVEEIARRVRALAQEKGPDEWVIGHSLGFEPFGGGMISSRPFEEAFDGRPGYLLFSDAHSMVANQRALQLAGISAASTFGNNSRVERDGTGELTGYVAEDPMAVVAALVPKLPFEEKLRAVRATLEAFAESGFTFLNQLNIEPGDIEILEELERRGDLPVRIRISPLWRSADDWDAMLEYCVSLQGRRGRRWWIEGVKLMLDGTIDHGTAWLHEPDTLGGGMVPMWVPAERFTMTLHALSAAGVPTATHAIGDRAVDVVLDSVASAPALPTGTLHRIEHVETISDATVQRFVELGVAASMQPTHMIGIRSDQSDRWSERLGRGELRTSQAWRIRDLVDAGVPVALGSDWPVVESDPREIINAAVLRRPLISSLPPLLPAQSLTAAEALRGLSQQVWASVGQPEHGIIQPGSHADFTVFDGDPTVASPEELATFKVVTTVVAGDVLRHEKGCGR